MIKPLRPLAVLMLSSLANPGHAAEVLLDNGDRLTGTVVSLEGGLLKLETGYAGVIEIDWGRVTRLETEKDVVVLTGEDDVIEGRLRTAPGEDYVVETTDGEQVDTPAEDVVAVNPEPWRTGRAVKWTGQVNAALKADRGNSDKDEIDFDTDMTWRRKDDRYVFRGELEYDTNLGAVTKQKWSALGKYDYFVSAKKYYAANAAFEHDKFKGLDWRYYLGPAVGYQYWEEEDRNLLAEVGVYYIASQIEGRGRSDSIGAGWLINVDHVIFDTTARAYHRQSMILSNPANANFRSRTGVGVPLGDSFVGSAEVEVNWDAETAKDADDTEVIYRFKLGYGW